LSCYLKKRGVIFVQDEICDVELKQDEVLSIYSKNNITYKADNFILASGINDLIAKKLNTNLMQIPTKGYSITLNINDELKPKIPIMLIDKFIILTPRLNDIRITSNLEIGSTNKNIDNKKIHQLLQRLKETTHDFDTSNIKPWCGFRALTPNDRSLLGRDKKYKNFIYSMGLGWLGITLAPSIAKMVSSLIIEDIDNNQQKDICNFSGLKF
jgi:D-amino-acid dehydrogenase